MAYSIRSTASRRQEPSPNGQHDTANVKVFMKLWHLKKSASINQRSKIVIYCRMLKSSHNFINTLLGEV